MEVLEEVKNALRKKYKGVMNQFHILIGERAKEYAIQVIRQACESERRFQSAKEAERYVLFSDRNYAVFEAPNFGRVRRRINYRLTRQTHHEYYLAILNPFNKENPKLQKLN